MAHEIAQKNGKHSMFSVKEMPWHGLGQILDKCPTSAEAIVHAGLDFQVEKASLTANIPGSFSPDDVPGNYATYRSDTNDIFGVVGERYTPLQNNEAFSFFDAIVGEGKAIYETAGALRNGEIVFITAKLPDYIVVDGQDIVDKYLLLTNRHDGKGSVQALFTPVRVVCANTLRLAMNDRQSTNRISIRHTKDVAQRTKEAAKVMGMANKVSDTLTEIFGQMARTRVNGLQTEAYLNDLFPVTEDENGKLSSRSRKIRSVVDEYLECGLGQELETCRGTVFGLYNAVTGYFQNANNYSTGEKKMYSMTFDSSADTMEKAYAMAVKLI